MANKRDEKFEGPHRKAAEQDAERIRAYWARRGIDVRVEVFRNPFTPEVKHPGYSVRTDLLNGLPRARPGRTRMTATPRKRDLPND